MFGAALLLIGAAAMCMGMWLISMPAAIMLAGGFCIAFGIIIVLGADDDADDEKYGGGNHDDSD